MNIFVFESFQSLVIPEKFQHILRIMNTNIDGNRKVTIAMTAIKGVGRRYANIVLKKADVDLTKRAGECTEEEVSSHLYYFLVTQNSRFVQLSMSSILTKSCAYVSITGRQNHHNHFKSTSIQNPKLVLEQTKGYH